MYSLVLAEALKAHSSLVTDHSSCTPSNPAVPAHAVQAEYHPSELLCPTALCWMPAARCLAALAKDGFVELSKLPDALDGHGAEQVP